MQLLCGMVLVIGFSISESRTQGPEPTEAEVSSKIKELLHDNEELVAHTEQDVIETTTQRPSSSVEEPTEAKVMAKIKQSKTGAKSNSWHPKEGDFVECRSLTTWVYARYVEMLNGMPICELNGVRRPFKKVRKPKVDPEKLADAKLANSYEQHATPELHGHTSQINPLKPNSDRKWYTEGRWKKGQQYHYQDGEITVHPAVTVGQVPRIPGPPVERDNTIVIAYIIAVPLVVVLCSLCGFAAWHYRNKMRGEEHV